ncbi:phospholipase D-like domain-containing protein [Candidatus Gromoviella agglomerans]|uniref:phospholipase D-like domain-containing protein n=1 Tax=Candidatus Gromoviella agglomerans TaxID=2806609 RepID=UPI001E5FEBCE|nr:phospholipase D-like domain-containing protein [Candidatus Gromoviella agglomerans]UFX98189.1 Phospholipase D family protein [Candidatus Gromoviella agglomerans]
MKKFLNKHKKEGISSLISGSLVALYFLYSDNTEKVKDFGILQNEISVFFAPQDKCTQSIIKEIANARFSIKIQAYSFTAEAIWRAIVERKEAGIDVEIILDHGQETAHHSLYKTVIEYKKIPLYIDTPGSSKKQLAHNKVIIIDDKIVITGSFNFSKNAENNAENLLIIRDEKIAKLYKDNWEYRKSLSKNANQDS